jgi:hypothetical protein
MHGICFWWSGGIIWSPWGSHLVGARCDGRCPATPRRRAARHASARKRNAAVQPCLKQPVARKAGNGTSISKDGQHARSQVSRVRQHARRAVGRLSDPGSTKRSGGRQYTALEDLDDERPAPPAAAGSSATAGSRGGSSLDSIFQRMEGVSCGVHHVACAPQRCSWCAPGCVGGSPRV